MPVTSDNKHERLNVLGVEPWFTESHRTLMEGVKAHSRHDVRLLTLPKARWRWRMRLGAMDLAEAFHRQWKGKTPPDMLFASGYVNLPQLVGFAPKLANVSKVVYFLEDQITYPVREGRERELEFVGINFATAVMADACVFCSLDQRDGFLKGLRRILKKVPGVNFEGKILEIENKSRVIPIGVEFSAIDSAVKSSDEKAGPLHILWPHRFEHDKGPDEFFKTLFALADEGLDFCVSVIGRQYRDAPSIFAEAKERLGDQIIHWGFLKGKDYHKALASSDVVVSTALQETQGLAVIEAMRAGCEPLLPHRLSYPEVLGEDADSHTYSSAGELRRRLRWMMKHPQRVRAWKSHAERVERFSWERVIGLYDELLENPKFGDR